MIELKYEKKLIPEIIYEKFENLEFQIKITQTFTYIFQYKKIHIL
jgi:hypothetical protein